ncbi:STAS domain-containing protein [Actinokineospora guangxiensis]|uniref:Anti-sigma factor antagonist n=1 Tax=Actinokineospora guangxiensis TaxID=1490288 RepID=A0ABW0EG49_9PSEU
MQTGPQLEISVERRGAAAVVGVRGEIDMATSAQLREALSAALAGTPDTVAVNLSEVAFISSSGLRELIVSRDQASDQGVRFILSNTPQAVRRVLDLTETTRLFVLASSVESALNGPDQH